MDNFMDKLAQKFSAQEMIKANSQAETEEMKRLQLQVSEYEKILQEMRKLNYKNTELSGKFEQMIGSSAGELRTMKEDEQKFIEAMRNLNDEQAESREAEQQKLVASLKELTGEHMRNRETEQKLAAALRELLDEQTRDREADAERREAERLERECEAETAKQMQISALTDILEEKFRRSEDFVHRENVKVYRNVQAVVVDELKKYADEVQDDRNSMNIKLIWAVALSAVSAMVSIGGVALCALMALGIL